MGGVLEVVAPSQPSGDAALRFALKVLEEHFGDVAEVEGAGEGEVEGAGEAAATAVTQGSGGAPVGASRWHLSVAGHAVVLHAAAPPEVSPAEPAPPEAPLAPSPTAHTGSYAMTILLHSSGWIPPMAARSCLRSAGRVRPNRR